MAWDQPHFFCLHDIVLFNIFGTAINMIEGNIDHLKCGAGSKNAFIDS